MLTFINGSTVDMITTVFSLILSHHELHAITHTCKYHSVALSSIVVHTASITDR